MRGLVVQCLAAGSICLSLGASGAGYNRTAKVPGAYSAKEMDDMLWYFSEFESEWEEFHDAKFGVNDFKVFKQHVLPGTSSCSRVQDIVDGKWKVRKPLDLQNALTHIRQCNRHSFQKYHEIAWKIRFEATLSLPSVQCENGLWGFDLGFNLGDYGVQIESSTVYGNWTKSVHDALLKAENLLTVPLGTRSSYVTDLKTYSGLPRSRLTKPVGKPSQEKRCDFVAQYGLRSRRPSDGGHSADGKLGIKVEGQTHYEGTTFFELQDLQDLQDPDENFKPGKVTFSGIKIRSRDWFRGSDSRIPHGPLLAREHQEGGIKHLYKWIEFQIRWICDIIKDDHCDIAGDWDLLTKGTWLDFWRNFYACRVWNIVRKGNKDCKPKSSVNIIVPLERYGSDIGFDLGLNLGDYGMEIQNNIIAVNWKGEGEKFIRLPSIKSAYLAPYTPKYHDFGYVKTTPMQRYAWVDQQPEISLTETYVYQTVWNQYWYEFKASGPIGGTVLLPNAKYQFVPGKSSVMLKLTPTNTHKSSDFPDLPDIL